MDGNPTYCMTVGLSMAKVGLGSFSFIHWGSGKRFVASFMNLRIGSC